MATYSSILAWRISGTEEPDGLLSMGSHRIRTYCSGCISVPVLPCKDALPPSRCPLLHLV